MGGQPVGGRRAGARAAALGACIAIAMATGIFGAATRADAVVDVSGTSVTLSWAPSSGPVHRYLVFVSRDGAPMGSEQAVATTQATLTGRPGETIQVQIAAWGPAGVGRMGPLSPPSPRIRFTSSSSPPPPDDDAGSQDPGSPDDGSGLPAFRATALVTMDRSWQVLDTGDFLGDGDDDVLFRFAGQDGVFVLPLSKGQPGRTRLVAWNADTAWRGPWRGDRDTLLLRTRSGDLEGWAFEPKGPERRWGVAQSGLHTSMAADLDGDAVEEVLRRFDDGSVRRSDGSALPLPALQRDQRVLVTRANGDAYDDLLVADLGSGRLDMWLKGRRRRNAPTLEANLEDLEVAWLTPDAPWLVGVDGGGRLRARRLDDPAPTTLAFVGRGARVHPADVDGDGRDELLVLQGNRLTLWRPGP